MSPLRGLTFAAALLCATAAWGQSATREPQIGYLYPAGAQRGTTIQIVAGGQFLGAATDVLVSGTGVRAKVVKHMRVSPNIQQNQRLVMLIRMAEVRDKRLTEAGVPAEAIKRIRAQADRRLAAMKKRTKIDGVKLPTDPLLIDLENKSLKELVHIQQMIFFPRQKRQINRQLSERVLIEIEVDPDAPPGDRELRIRARNGLTRPVVFQVGQLPQVRETEPNDLTGDLDSAGSPAMSREPTIKPLLEQKPFDLPVLLNGQIMPGDVDRFRIRAKAGQKLVIEASARRLVPYLADAVPGWFQATLALYDAAGNEVAFADDYRFDPDPVLFCKIPKDGVYEIEIRDAIYRGREDFVYRIAVSEQPFVTHIFPLGGRQGAATAVTIDGWNLSAKRLALNTKPGDDWVRYASSRDGALVSNTVPYAVDTLPECRESEPNDTAKDAQRIFLPRIINGRIGKDGDVDVFRIDGNAGQEIVAEVAARRLHSPLDSLLRLTDASGKVLQWNDDHMRKDGHLHVDSFGLSTHHADSYLTVTLPKKGTYYVQLSDAQRHGSDAHAYRLRLSAPQPDFALRVTPSGLHMRPGAVATVDVYVMRKDGFNGEIEMKITSPAGFAFTDGRIPAGCDRLRMTLVAPKKAPAQAVALKIVGVAKVGTRTITRPAGCADNVMQAFLYRHLLPAREFTVAVVDQKWPVPPMTVTGPLPVRIPLGGSTQVIVKGRNSKALRGIILDLNDPPEGVTLHGLTAVPDGLQFQLSAEKDVVKIGFADNLIVEAFRTYTAKNRQGKPIGKRRARVGFLPAIPIEIVAP